MLIKINCMAAKDDKVSLTQTIPAILNVSHIIYIETFNIEHEEGNIVGVSIYLDSGNIFYARMNEWNYVMESARMEELMF